MSFNSSVGCSKFGSGSRRGSLSAMCVSDLLIGFVLGNIAARSTVAESLKKWPFGSAAYRRALWCRASYKA